MRTLGTVLTCIRAPTGKERAQGAEIVFERVEGDRAHVILAARYEGWMQWGAPRAVLADNVRQVVAWRRRPRLFPRFVRDRLPDERPGGPR